MKSILRYCLLISTGSIATTNAATNFVATIDSDLNNAANWTNGRPSSGNNGTININGFYTLKAQTDGWIAGSSVVVGGGAVLTLSDDLAVAGATMTVGNATINATDDIFVDTGTLILNVGSIVTAVDDFEANNGAGRIIINGGIHSSGSSVGNIVGAQGGGTKTGCGIDMLGGQITAGSYRYQMNSTNSVGGGGVLLSASSSTTLDMSGSMNILPSWTGRWEVGAFTTGAWKTEVTGGGWTLDGLAIDNTIFDNNFNVSVDGKTLSLVPEPSIPALCLLAGLGAISRRRRA